VPSFSRLEVSDSFTVDVSGGDVEEVTVRVDDNLVGLLDIGGSGDMLRIGGESRTDVLDATLEDHVTVSSLDELRAAGASTVRLVDPLAGDTLGVSISGSSRLPVPLISTKARPTSRDPPARSPREQREDWRRA
jgi:hypothetical protein